jgi:ribosome-associated protein
VHFLSPEIAQFRTSLLHRQHNAATPYYSLFWSGFKVKNMGDAIKPTRLCLDVGSLLIIAAYLVEWHPERLLAGMEAGSMIEITNDIFLSEDELIFRASRSSGPGGQNVNKANTRVTLLFDVADCEVFSDMQKERILAQLTGRVDKSGVIRVVSQKFRTQKANRNAAVERLQQLLAGALKTRPPRKESEVPYAAKKQRLEQKRRRSLLKRQRARRNSAGDLAD